MDKKQVIEFVDSLPLSDNYVVDVRIFDTETYSPAQQRKKIRLREAIKDLIYFGLSK